MIFKGIISLLFLLLILIAGWFSYAYINVQNKNMENLARYQCAQSVRYEVRTSTTTVSYAPADLYKKCLKEKGL